MMIHLIRLANLCAAMVCLSALDAIAAEGEPEGQHAASGGTRRALIVCGLPGDADHRQLFAETVEQLYTALTTRLEFSPEHSVVLFGDETTENDGPALRVSRGPATREALTTATREIVAALDKDDSLWVIVLGHAHFDGRLSWLNLPGPDIHQGEFGKLFEAVSCREQVFFITTPVSGFFIKPLSVAGRIVISATESDAEVNETLFPIKLAAVLAEPPVLEQLDTDGDGRATLFDIYLWCAREVAQEYASGELLATEHSLLDDDGDGRGHEVQLDYLSEELGGRRRAGRQLTPRAGDGGRTRAILLPVAKESS